MFSNLSSFRHIHDSWQCCVKHNIPQRMQRLFEGRTVKYHLTYPNTWSAFLVFWMFVQLHCMFVCVFCSIVFHTLLLFIMNGVMSHVFISDVGWRHFCWYLKRDPKQTEPARPSLPCFVHPVKTIMNAAQNPTTPTPCQWLVAILFILVWSGW